MPTHSIEDVLNQREELTLCIRAHAPEADRLARLPENVVHELIQLRLFRLWIPKSFGGFELDLPQTLHIYEAAATIDGSVGWAVMIGSGGGLFAAYLDPIPAAEIYSASDAVIAGSGAPSGQAERIPGGYRASGRWSYASGAHYATTFTANCVITNNGNAILDATGMPLIRAMAFERADVKIHDSWNTIGMRGTGSHDFSVAEAFVPELRTFSVFTDTPRENGPLYRLPFDVLTELPVTAVAVGIARHALDAFATLAQTKRSAHTEQPLATESLVQIRFAESQARWYMVRAALHSLASQAWELTLSNRAMSSARLAEITASCALGVAELRTAIGDLAELAGMTAIDNGTDFARAWRDLQTIAAHYSVSPRRLGAAGHVLMAQS